MSGSVNRYARFMRKVDHQGFSVEKCWHWMGGTKGNGYGVVRSGGKYFPAHRYAYMLFVSADIPGGMDVCHTCDVRSCVNPHHLFLGTRSENMADMVAKGRGAGGCRKHLREAQVQEIRQRLRSGHPPRRIARQMNVNYSTVTAIKGERSYVGIGQ